MTTFCNQCGSKNADDARFCSQCGHRLDAERPGETTATITFGEPVKDRHEHHGDDPADSLSTAERAAVEALPPRCALLVVQRGPSAGSRFLLDTDAVTVGRHQDSDIFLDDVTVSRRHAEFRRRGDGFTVSDAGSLNGTYVNRDRIDELELANGDEVQIGKFRLVYFANPRRGEA